MKNRIMFVYVCCLKITVDRFFKSVIATLISSTAVQRKRGLMHNSEVLSWTWNSRSLWWFHIAFRLHWKKFCFRIFVDFFTVSYKKTRGLRGKQQGFLLQMSSVLRNISSPNELGFASDGECTMIDKTDFLSFLF